MGYVAAFQAGGHQVYQAAVSTFFRFVTSTHSYVTGGSNDREFWGPPSTLADAITNVRPACMSTGQCLSPAHKCISLCLQGAKAS